MAVYGDGWIMDGWTEGRTDEQATDGCIVCMSVYLIGYAERTSTNRQINYYTHTLRHSRKHAKIKHSWMHTKGWTEEWTEAHTCT